MTDICAEVRLWNENVEGMIRILGRLQAAGILTQEEAVCHEARLETLRARLNAALRDVIGLRERIDSIRPSAK